MAAQAGNDAFLRFTNVKKTYDHKTLVVKDFNLNVAKGEFITLLGPSGSGKTTCLMMLAGFEDVTSGEILINGRNVTSIAPYDRNIGMVFQQYALFPHMTIRENLAYPLKIRKLPKDEIRAKVEDYLALVELQAFGGRYPGQLSGGQRQRVAIGRAIVRNPKIFLFDEPLSNLDAALRVQTRLELARLHKELQATMIYVTHDQVEAMTLADKVVVLNGGRVEQVGSPLELYHHPANLFVAGFLGTPKMGFLRGSVTRADAASCEVRLDCGPSLTLPLCATDLGPDSQVTLGLRPEHLNVVSAGSGRLQVTADVSERLGSDTFCHVRSASGEMLTVRVRGDFAPRYGDALSLDFDTAHCHLFAADGRAIGKPLQQAA